MDNPWKSLNQKKVYETPWITVYHEDVITPGRSKGIYGWVSYKHLALGVIPIDEEGYTWLVGQYRYPGKYYSWEIPEGGGKMNEEPLDAIARELKEETGLTASHYEHLQTMHLSNSVSNEVAHIYLATGLTLDISTPEDTEELLVKRVPLKEAIDMVHSGEITDSMSVAGLLKLHILLETKHSIPNTPFQ